MITRFVVVLSESDRSGVRQAFGPYDTEEQAKATLKVLETWPALSSGLWDIVPCADLGPGGTPPAPITPPTMPYTPMYPTMPVYPTAPYITCTTADTPKAALYNAAWTRFGWTREETDSVPDSLLRSILSEGGE
jgi:hypothetical protein